MSHSAPVARFRLTATRTDLLFLLALSVWIRSYSPTFTVFLVLTVPPVLPALILFLVFARSRLPAVSPPALPPPRRITTSSGVWPVLPWYTNMIFHGGRVLSARTLGLLT